MNKRISGICACMVAALFVMQTASGGLCSAAEKTGAAGTATVKSQGGRASLLDENAGAADMKTIYGIDDYKTNEVLVMYTDGSFELLQCGSRSGLKTKLSELASDSRVEVYQPNFTYEADAVYTETVDGSTRLPVYYGASGENSDIAANIETSRNTSIANAHPTSPSDTYYHMQWALHNDGSFTGARENVSARAGVDIDAPEAWAKYGARKSTVIALVDTGVDYTNREIRSSMWTNSGEIPGNGIDDDGNGYVDDYRGWNFYNNNNVMYSGANDDHGTHCAGSMAARSDTEYISGITGYSNIKLMNVKALGGSDGEGTTLSVMRAIIYAEDNGAEICNLSLGTDVNDYLLYRTMRDSDMLFVIAAGNSESVSTRGRNIDVYPCYPASYTLDNIISVANINAAGNLHYTSNYGKNSVDLAAPGSDILGIVSGRRLGFMTGTSMAAPMVSAAAAMVYTGSRTRTLSDTKKIIVNSVRNMGSISGTTATGGMLNLANAVAWR